MGTSDDPAGPRGLFSRVRLGSELRFVLSFALIAGVLFSFYSFPYPEGSRAQRASDSYLEAYAHLAGWVLSLFERHVAVWGQTIVGARYSLRIVRGCDAVDAQVLFAAAVLASHAYAWRWRVAGALAGLGLITIANVARICCLYYVGALLPEHFDFFHHELWPMILVALAAGTFVGWSRIAAGRGVALRAAG